MGDSWDGDAEMTHHRRQQVFFRGVSIFIFLQTSLVLVRFEWAELPKMFGHRAISLSLSHRTLTAVRAARLLNNVVLTLLSLKLCGRRVSEDNDRTSVYIAIAAWQLVPDAFCGGLMAGLSLSTIHFAFQIVVKIFSTLLAFSLFLPGPWIHCAAAFSACLAGYMSARLLPDGQALRPSNWTLEQTIWLSVSDSCLGFALAGLATYCCHAAARLGYQLQQVHPADGAHVEHCSQSEQFAAVVVAQPNAVPAVAASIVEDEEVVVEERCRDVRLPVGSDGGVEFTLAAVAVERAVVSTSADCMPLAAVVGRRHISSSSKSSNLASTMDTLAASSREGDDTDAETISECSATSVELEVAQMLIYAEDLSPPRHLLSDPFLNSHHYDGRWKCCRQASKAIQIADWALDICIRGRVVVLGNGETTELQISGSEVFLDGGRLIRVGKRLLRYGTSCKSLLVYEEHDND
eukprot:TRINITY_DN15452_c0_g1_i7.p1 TRINITY_DN15452_c0_g1~~TRINITY_DN15452_c0_g1_i7.p1  ORF type:complete len:463 (+),score=59.88 TRINITY_DN15452_c0_g1_i7:88-1476(+)